MHYNLLNFGSGGDCPSVSSKINYLNTITDHVLPDIVTVNELKLNIQNGKNTRADKILDEVFNDDSTYFERALDTYISEGDLTNMVFYNSNKVELIRQDFIKKDVSNDFLTRGIDFYYMYHKDIINNDTIFFMLVVAHLKASDDEEYQRAKETEAIMDYLNSNSVPQNIILCGDLNFYTYNEDGFQNLINNSTTKLNDPVNQLGNWHNSSTYKNYHTQATHTEQNCGASGGMNDRFDFILMSSAIMNNTDGMTYIAGSYTTLGQDGSFFNQALSVYGNSAVDELLASSLYNMSDHLPIIAEVYIDPLYTSVQFPNKGIVNFKAVNPVNDNKLQIIFESPNLLLQNELLQYDVFSLDGRNVFSTQKNLNHSKQTILTPTLKDGLYFLKVTSRKNGLIGSERLVILN